MLFALGVGDRVVGVDEFSDYPAAAADPEVILGATLEDVARRPGWDRITAIRTKRVFAFTPEERALIVRPGPRLAAGLAVLVDKVHREGSP
jgi:ABC-type Fe3+-hydroxamate transport system substrate-binding protein